MCWHSWYINYPYSWTSKKIFESPLTIEMNVMFMVLFSELIYFNLNEWFWPKIWVLITSELGLLLTNWHSGVIYIKYDFFASHALCLGPIICCLFFSRQIGLVRMRQYSLLCDCTPKPMPCWSFHLTKKLVQMVLPICSCNRATHVGCSVDHYIISSPVNLLNKCQGPSSSNFDNWRRYIPVGCTSSTGTNYYGC